MCTSELRMKTATAESAVGTSSAMNACMCSGGGGKGDLYPIQSAEIGRVCLAYLDVSHPTSRPPQRLMVKYGVTELAKAYRLVRKNTIQIATEIPEDKYDFVAAPGT